MLLLHLRAFRLNSANHIQGISGLSFFQCVSPLDRPDSRSCVWWDEASLSWSGSGCSLSLEETDDAVTVCYCDHLTNFGIMFDYIGEAEPGDTVLSILSWILLIISSVAILITQILLFRDKVY